MKILWVTSGLFQRNEGKLTSTLASARYRILIPAAELAKYGVRSEFLDAADLDRGKVTLPSDLNVLVISKCSSPFAEALAQRARERGAAIVVDFCDDYFSQAGVGGLHLRLATMADLITVSSSALGDVLHRLTKRSARVIKDPCEGPRGTPQFQLHQPPLKLLWYGSPRNLEPLIGFMPDLTALNTQFPLNLTIITNVTDAASDQLGPYTTGKKLPRAELKQWSLETTWSALSHCDMVIIPSSERQLHLIKGPNRLAEALWAGRCVAAHPLESYKEFGQWAFLDSELCSAIERAIDEAPHVPARIRAAQDYLAKHYTAGNIGEQWHATLQDAALLAHTPRPSETKLASSTTPPLRLNLGCGDKRLTEYVNVDVVDERSGNKPDVVCDIRKLTAFESNSADEILAVHVIEHLWRWEVVDVLKEWVRALKPGAKMILECPNLKSACEEFLRDPGTAAKAGSEGQRTMWVFYGDPKWRDPLMVHRWGYTPESLIEVMNEAGLVNLRQEPAQFKLREPRDMRIVGEKPRH